LAARPDRVFGALWNISVLFDMATVERESKMMELCYAMMDEISMDLSETRQSVQQTRSRNLELEKLVSQLTYDNNRVKEKLNMALQRLDENEGHYRKNELHMLAEVEQARQAAAGEIDRALGGLRQSTEANIDLEDRALRAEARYNELERDSAESYLAMQRLQQQLLEANQMVASLNRRVEESERYTRTLEAALTELRQGGASFS